MQVCLLNQIIHCSLAAHCWWFEIRQDRKTTVVVQSTGFVDVHGGAELQSIRSVCDELAYTGQQYSE